MAAETKIDIWMPLYISDFLMGTLGWSAEERGHYLLLLMSQWSLGGLPPEPEALERISPGLSRCWTLLSAKFPAGPDGRLRNLRLEEHRAASQRLREARSAKASAAARRRWEDGGSYARSNAPSIAPSNAPSNARHRHIEERQHARAGRLPPPAAEPAPWEAGPGWAHAEWAKVVAAWNACPKAVPWMLLSPPNGFADLAASPGWLASAMAGIEALAECHAWERPVPWTQFCRELDRILAGEFRERAGEKTAAAGRPTKRGNMR